MKITAKEEYGLRILLQIARNKDGICISHISESEGLTHHNVAKLCRELRMHGYIESKKGHTGGYMLSRPPKEINLKDVLHKLGGTFYHENFCEQFSGENNICTHSVDCSLRSLWKVLQSGIDQVLEKLTLQDLIGSEEETKQSLCGNDQQVIELDYWDNN